MRNILVRVNQQLTGNHQHQKSKQNRRSQHFLLLLFTQTSSFCFLQEKNKSLEAQQQLKKYNDTSDGFFPVTFTFSVYNLSSLLDMKHLTKEL